jgi:hypothetical protein
MEQSAERKAHGVKVFLGTFKSSRDAIAGMVTSKYRRAHNA